MKVSDLVQRKYEGNFEIEKLGIGIILSLQLGGRNPVHTCATVFYPKSCNTWDIAESLIEVVYEIT